MRFESGYRFYHVSFPALVFGASIRLGDWTKLVKYHSVYWFCNIFEFQFRERCTPNLAWPKLSMLISPWSKPETIATSILERHSFERVYHSLESFPLRSRVPLACRLFGRVSFVDRDTLIDCGISLTSLSMSLRLAFRKRNSGYAQFLCFQYLDASRINP
jgi:hypothetical protein